MSWDTASRCRHCRTATACRGYGQERACTHRQKENHKSSIELKHRKAASLMVFMHQVWL